MVITLLLLGIFLLIINYLIESAFNDTLTNKYVQENPKKSAAYDFNDADIIELSGFLEAKSKIDDIHLVGRISIPSVNMSVPIGIGRVSTLALTAGIMTKNQIMGQDN